MTDKSRGDPGARRSKWLWLVVLSAVAAGMYASIFVKIAKFGF